MATEEPLVIFNLYKKKELINFFLLFCILKFKRVTNVCLFFCFVTYTDVCRLSWLKLFRITLFILCTRDLRPMSKKQVIMPLDSFNIEKENLI